MEEPTNHQTAEEVAGKSPRELDLESLKALAHPLRVQLLNALSVHGPLTATKLAERFAESSGATSYHLRQLERHGFVREVDGRGTGRERWWEMTPGGISIGSAAAAESPAGLAATQTIVREFERSRSALLSEFLDNAPTGLPEDWFDAATVASSDLRMTSEQLSEVGAQWLIFVDTVLRPMRGLNLPGSRPVQVHFNAFPVIGGEATSPHSQANTESSSK